MSDEKVVSFFVPGIPKTAGSKRAFMPKGWKRPIIVDDCKKVKDWRGDVKRFAIDAIGKNDCDFSLLEGPLAVTLTFVLPRPKSHFKGQSAAARMSGAKALLRDNAPRFHTSKPDVLKMARAVEDALTGVVWHDDAQIAVEMLSKHYGERPGCLVNITGAVEMAQEGEK